MKKLIFALTLLMKVFALPAQNSDAKTIAEIRNLEEKEHLSMLHQDGTSLQKIWSDDFMVNAPFNRVTLSSAEVIGLVKKGVIRYSSFTRNIEQILVKKDVAITMGSEEVIPVGEDPRAGQTIKRRYTNIWIKQKGEWRLTARHANEIL